jgi:geranylgeranylglycerol-phosphate geranylgeranyltransferase
MVAAGACVYAAYYLSGGRLLAPIVWPVVFAGLVAGLGNLVNDFFDADIDRVNKPHRPIPSGRLSRRYVASVYAAGTAVLSGAMLLVLPASILLLMVAWEILLFLYAAWAKRVALLGNVLISAVCASAFVVGTMITGRHEIIVFPVAFAFVFVMGRELIKSAEDVDGDRSAGASTLAVRWGAENSAQWGALLLLLCTASAALPALTGHFSRDYGVIVGLAVVPGTLFAAYLVLKRPQRDVFHRAAWILKFEMLAGIVVMGLGRTSF